MSDQLTKQSFKKELLTDDNLVVHCKHRNQAIELLQWAKNYQHVDRANVLIDILQNKSVIVHKIRECADRGILCLRLGPCTWDKLDYYEKEGNVIMTFDEAKETIDLPTESGIVSPPIEVEYADHKNTNWSRGKLIYVSNGCILAIVTKEGILEMRDRNYVRLPLTKTTVPLTFDDLCAIARKGATFNHLDGSAVCNVAVGQTTAGGLRTHDRPVTDFVGYTLPDDPTVYPMTKEI